MRRLSHGLCGTLCAGLLLTQTAASAAPSVARVTTPGGAAAASAAPGDELLIQGSGFGSDTGEVWLDRGGYGREAQVLAWNGADGSIRIRIPSQADLGSIRLIVRAGDAGSSPYPLQIAASGSQPAPPAPVSPPTPPPTVSPSTPPPSLPPGTPDAPEIRGVYVLGGGPTASGIIGTRVLVSGARLGSSGALSFNGAAAMAIMLWNPTYIVATLPNAPGTGPVTVHRDPGLPDEATGVGPAFTIVPAPVITDYAQRGVATARMHPGEVIAIRGTNLGSGGQVLIQSMFARVQSWSPQEIDVVVPRIVGTGPVQITLNPHTAAVVKVNGPDLTVATAN